MDTVFDRIKAQAVKLSIGEYAPIRADYAMAMRGIIMEYLLTENVRVTRFKSMFKRAISEAFTPAFELGLKDGGGEGLAQGEDLAWINAKVEAEYGYADMLFQQLKEFKASEGVTTADFEAEAARRSEGYAKTLDGVYSEGKIRGTKDQMLTFGGEDGQESCPECQKWKGKRHRASFWIKRGLIPGQPGNSSFSCHGYNCKHVLYSDKGEVFRA